MSPRLGLMSSLTTSGKAAGGEAPAETIGTVTVTGSVTPTLNSTENYAAAYDGTATGVTYTWSVTGDTLAEVSAGQGTATATITFGRTGAAVVRCQISKAGASDTPQTGNKSVTVAFNDTYAVNFDGVTTYADLPTAVSTTIAAGDGTTATIAWRRKVTWEDVTGESFIGAMSIGTDANNKMEVAASIWNNTAAGGPTSIRFRVTQKVSGTFGGAIFPDTLPVALTADTYYTFIISYSLTASNFSIRTYIDGESLDTVNPTVIVDRSTESGYFNADVVGTPSPGSLTPMTECAVWNRFCTVAELGYIANSETMFDWSQDSGSYNFSSNLVHWWRFGDGTDERTAGTVTINDVKGSSNLTLYAGESVTV